MVSRPLEYTAEATVCPVCGGNKSYKLCDRKGYNDAFICANPECDWFVEKSDYIWVDVRLPVFKRTYARNIVLAVEFGAEKIVCPSCGWEPSYRINALSHSTVICLNPACKWYLSALDERWDLIAERVKKLTKKLGT